VGATTSMTDPNEPTTIAEDAVDTAAQLIAASAHDTLKYHLLGPSLTKAGQDDVDQAKVRCSRQ